MTYVLEVQNYNFTPMLYALMGIKFERSKKDRNKLANYSKVVNYMEDDIDLD